MKTVVVLIAVFFLFYFSFVKSAFAVSVDVFSFPNTLTDEPFILTASISGAATGTNYLRVDLYKDGSPNYFGETYNGNDWYNGSDGLQYLSVSVVKGSTASATVQGRVGNPSSDDFAGNGAYKLRVRRYTNSGAPGSDDTISSVDIAINLPPTPTVTLAPTSTSAPASTPTKTPTFTPIPNTPTPTLKPLISPTKTPVPSGKVLPTFILGESTESGLFVSPTNKPLSKIKSSNNSLQKVLMGVGVVFIAFCAILIFRKVKKGKLTHNEEE